MRSKTFRRHQRERMRAHARNVVVNIWGITHNTEDMVNHLADDMCNCSCSYCGNPRRSVWNKGKNIFTIAERKARDSYNDQIEDFLNE